MIFHSKKKFKQRFFTLFLFYGLFLLNFHQSTGQSFIVANSTSDKLTKLFHDFPDSFRIQKDPNDPSRLLNVYLPSKFQRFKQFIAKVTDTSPDVEFPMKDVNRTFLASPTDSSIINIHGLNAGHQYSITVYGRIEGDSQLIKEESVIMDPLPLDFYGLHSKIQATYHNVTMKTLKPEKALQDTFRVEYVQLDPPKRYPILDVHDIQEQRDVELYLGNLNPGKDYDVMVTSLRNGLPSTPWKGIITTKPLKPGQLIVQEVNSTCINLSWILPAESGADKFKIAYGILKGETDMIKLEVPYIKQQVDLCLGIVPGYTFIFAVIAEKSNQISDPATISYTIKPLPAENIKIEPDFIKGKYKIDVELPTKINSKIEKCQISVFSDQLEKFEEIVKIEEIGINEIKCLTYMQLIPGRRYEISVATLSGSTIGTKIFRSLALEPGFDMNAFGLILAENKGILRLEWPPSEVSMAKIKDSWNKIVGNDSQLHLKIEPVIVGKGSSKEMKETVRQVETNPSNNEASVVVDHLRRGACYRIQMYTVTSSGIVSSKRFEEHLRITAPIVTLSVDQITKNTAVLKISVTTSQEKGFDVSSDISDCMLNVVVMDTQSTVIYDRTLKLIDSVVPNILLEGLRPFHQYSINSQIICGDAKDQICGQKSRIMSPLGFETKQDRPGPVQNFSVKALNPYSIQASWYPPALPNGVITHYLILVNPVDPTEKPWTVNVGANIDSSLNSLIEAVVDNLVGGQSYQLSVQAVTEAGKGDLLSVTDGIRIEMPIMAPPRPSSRIEILPNTVRSTDLTIRYNTIMFSTKHGLLTKAAIIVAQVSSDGRTNENWFFDAPNKSLTWGQVQRFDIWPPYVTLETPIEPLKRFAAKPISEIIGIDTTCADQDSQSICNGLLKPGSGYRFKLRLYTAPNLWTDTLYSDVIVTEPLQVGTTFKTIFLVTIFLLIFICLGIFIYWFIIRPKNKKGSSLPFVSSRSSTGSSFNRRNNNQTNQQTKESQWAALKMIMAERAADSLAKLGLYPATTSTTNNNPINSCNGLSATNLLNGTVTPMETDGSITAPILQNNGLAAGNTNIFNIHHRRSKSLRERTGVDQRLERLPSGPPPGQKSVLWTVVKSSNIDKTRPVKIIDFIEHVRLMSADSDFRFSEEYEDLKFVGNGQTCIAADLTVNRSKNRFTNILPFDHSRVKLMPTDDDEGSDYINANYIPGFNSRREFIAAQGPLPSTRDDFWRVVWEQQCPAIIALTKCIEKGRDKCHQYWPDNNQRSCLYGDVEVTLLNESIYEEFVIRELRLQNMRENSQTARNVTHFHYMAWPDFGVPENPSGIVSFARLFRNILPPSPQNKPTIVHCSAGVGRSGSFMAMDKLMHDIDIGKDIDVFGSVYQMRLERCHMVQNEQQYIFIHHCLVYILENYYSHLINPTGLTVPNYGFVPPTPGFTIFNNSTPRIEVHQNPAFIEDDEGIAESGL